MAWIWYFIKQNGWKCQFEHIYFSDKQKGAIPPQPKFTPKQEKDDMNKQEKINDKKVGCKNSTSYEKIKFKQWYQYQ
jgi:hypothetical protein